MFLGIFLYLCLMHTLQKVLQRVDLGAGMPRVSVCIAPTFLDSARLFSRLVWQLTLSRVVYVSQACFISSPNISVVRPLSFCDNILGNILKQCHVVSIFVSLHLLDYYDYWRDRPSFHRFTSCLVFLFCVVTAFPFILLLLCPPELVFS